ncbi:BZ3500_MvSof-1268-A1-R1_Chr10-1g02543 [Microbotryum saponariae]|uniref:BZ3500_MvSof-1268-A1-R1_Chr10-1g02543 protein n=1 Tax=Microbotryum saponariae TaxID=289078 RepID=A0A2X0L990_9BASI|nr:BZ3500_MvSof-1268-A1-R1_Chr10-1g02543 [Microbotryum saponariae]SDA06032.1 BZ3501_MvSof-1269-A2-R1_Chr10-1g02144 [Microbotryum saponariae]
MPPRRATGVGRNSVSSVGAAAAPNGTTPATPRRTGRASSTTPADVATTASSAKPTSRTVAAAKRVSSTSAKPASSGATKRARSRSRSVSVALTVAEQSEQEQEEEDDDDVDPTPRAKKIKVFVEPKLKPVRAPVQGMNQIPKRYDPFPAYSAFDFEVSIDEVQRLDDYLPRTVFVFGNGDFGQHGLGIENGMMEIVRPRLHATIEKMIAVDGGQAWKRGVASLECGGMHTLCVDGEGKIWSWGINDNAALGRVTAGLEQESEELETQPLVVENLDYSRFKAVKVAAGDSVSLAVSENGELRCWGSFRYSEGILGFDGNDEKSKSQLKPLALKNLEAVSIVQVVTGDDHFVALTTKGTVFACGNGEQCQLGRKIIQRHKTHGLTPERLALKNIVVVGSGSYHSFAVDAKGQVFAWGLNSFRQTGVDEDDGGWQEIITTPTIVKSLHPSLHRGARVVQIVGGTHHTLFLFSNGEVWGCGRCDGSEIGLGKDHPKMKEMKEREDEALKRRKEFENSVRPKIAQRPVAADDAGNPGRPMTEMEIDLKAQEEAAQTVPLPNRFIDEPTKIEFDTDAQEEENIDGPVQIVQIAVGTRANFAVSKHGFLYAWGYGNVAQLGLGDEEEADRPTRVVSRAMKGFKVLHAAGGGQHSVCVAVRGDGAKPSVHDDATAAAPAA